MQCPNKNMDSYIHKDVILHQHVRVRSNRSYDHRHLHTVMRCQDTSYQL